MARRHGGGKIAGDYGSAGAVVGFLLSLLVFAALIWQSIRIDRSAKANAQMGCSCLLRLAALLVLTLGLGAGYMIGRSIVKV